jgi:hypothetical protein
MTVPIFLDFITVLCLLAGCLLLWFNLRRYGSDIILTNDPGVAGITDPENVPQQEALFEMLPRPRSEEIDRTTSDANAAPLDIAQSSSAPL